MLRSPPLLDDQLCFVLHATSRAVTRAYAPLLAPLGVTYPQYLVLLVLWEQSDLTVSGLGDRLFLDSGTLTPLLKRLESLGVVTRSRDLDDERQVRVSLTPAGSRLRQKAVGMGGAVACALGVEAAEISALRESLRRLLLRFHDARGPSGPLAPPPGPLVERAPAARKKRK